MITAIIFDFGNVICKFDNNLFLEKISKQTKKSVAEIKSLIYDQSDLPRLYETGNISSNEFYKRTVKLCELSISKENFIQAFTDKFTPINSTFEVIKKLDGHYKLALLSNTSEWDFNFGIKPTKILNYFDSVTVSFQVGAMKPDNKIYYDCLNKLNKKPSECIYIDDIKANSDKATKLGMHGVDYTSHSELLNSLKSINVLL